MELVLIERGQRRESCPQAKGKRRGPDPCLKVSERGLAREPNCGQPQPWPSPRWQDDPDSAGDGGWRFRPVTKNTDPAKPSVDTSCASDKRGCLLNVALCQALHTHS